MLEYSLDSREYLLWSPRRLCIHLRPPTTLLLPVLLSLSKQVLFERHEFFQSPLRLILQLFESFPDDSIELCVDCLRAADRVARLKWIRKELFFCVG